MKKVVNYIKSEIKNVRIPVGIDAIYIYGSILKDNLRKDSDIDLAILPSLENDNLKKLELISKIEAIFTSLFANLGFKQEISILDLRAKYVSVQLLYKVITEGVLIYEKERYSKIEFENFVKREYFDFMPYLKFLRRIKNGKLYQKV